MQVQAESHRGQKYFVDIEGVAEVREIFLHPRVSAGERPRWTTPDPDGVREMLCGEFDFSRDRIDAALAKFGDARAHTKQRTLDVFP